MTAYQIAYGVNLSGARLVRCRYEPHQHMEGVAGDRIASEQEGAICQRQRQQRQRRRCGFRMDFSEHAGAVFYKKVFGVRDAGECAAVQVAAVGVLRSGWQARLDQDRPGAAAANAPPAADAAQALCRPPPPPRAAPPSTPKANAKIAASKLSASKVGIGP